MIHVLFEGNAVCGRGPPWSWGPGDKWVRFDDPGLLNELSAEGHHCALCLFHARQRWPETWQTPATSAAMQANLKSRLIEWDRERLIGEEQD